MKTLLLFRHGKSDWDADYDRDHTRPLAERGRKDARKMGRFLVSARAVPERALSSSATRARETLRLAAEAGGWEATARITDALYAASASAVLREIQATPDDAAVLLVAGHEPTTSALVALLIGGGHVEVKTATVARVDVNVDHWADIRPGRGALVWLMPPGAFRPRACQKLRRTLWKARRQRKRRPPRSA
jgi:phosphohistidine phosphatase